MSEKVQDEFKRAQYFIKSRRFDDASHILDNLQREGCDLEEFYYCLGVVSFFKNDTKKAERYFFQTIEKNYRHANAHFYIAKIARQQRNNEKEQHFLRLTIKLDPNHKAAKKKMQTLEPSDNAYRKRGAISEFIIPEDDNEFRKYVENLRKRERAKWWIQHVDSKPWFVRAFWVIWTIFVFRLFLFGLSKIQ